jgi:hypothetical protein
MLRFDIPHTLISRAEIDADDARLATKYPGTWQIRPGSIEYAAVSAVGFNADKTKAMLYVKMRSQGGLYLMEKRAGVWSRADHPSCGWIV